MRLFRAFWAAFRETCALFRHLDVICADLLREMADRVEMGVFQREHERMEIVWADLAQQVENERLLEEDGRQSSGTIP